MLDKNQTYYIVKFATWYSIWLSWLQNHPILYTMIKFLCKPSIYTNSKKLLPGHFGQNTAFFPWAGEISCLWYNIFASNICEKDQYSQKKNVDIFTFTYRYLQYLYMITSDAWYGRCTLCDMITHPCPNCNGGSTKTPLSLWMYDYIT